MKILTGKQCGIVTTLVAGIITTGSAWALGFRNPDQGARATGQGEAFVAQADDASAIYYNPAGLTQQTGTELTSGGYLDFAGSHFSGADPKNTTTSFLPQVYFATDFGKTNSPWRVGLGFNIPFGEKVDLGTTGHFNHQVTKTSLAVYNISPSVAYRFNDQFSLGVDLNVYHGETMLENKVAMPFGLPDANFDFHGAGDAVGVTVGALYKINDKHTVGAVYRSPFTINFSGHAVARDAVPAASSGPSPAHVEINFPQSVAVGYAYRPIAKLKLEVDVEWTNWDPLNTVQLRSINPLLTGAQGYNWKDSFFYEFGAQYDLNEHWTVRGGYIFSENTVPDSTFTPAGPDSDRHVLSVGLGYGTKRMQVDVAYQYSFTVSRTVAGSPGTLSDGKWTTDGHALMVTSTLKF